MGEIATWSAVKLKVGLGKDSNECPTKAELLALSPMGTGEDYVGLEISNASSYGDNETVQLSDIHKVTYKYTFSQAVSTLTYTALGGRATNNNGIFKVTSTKRKYLDGVTSGSDIVVAYNTRALPDWAFYEDDVIQASENTNLEDRSYTNTLTQEESGKTLTYSFQQAAATSTWEYTFQKSSQWLSDTYEFPALAGDYTTATGSSLGSSYKQEYRNGHPYGNRINVLAKISINVSWVTINKTTFDFSSGEDLTFSFTENKSERSRSSTLTFTQEESGKTFTAARNQAAGVKTYGDITVTPTGDIADILASGGTSGTFTYTYSQPWGWNGKTNDGGTITSGAEVSWSEAITGSNLGTMAKSRTKLGTRTVTVTLNGKTGTATKDIYQAENKIINTTQGEWVVSISANPSTFTGQGGTSQISASAKASRTNHWTSGATSAASDVTATPTLSIPTPVTGFSLSGITLTVAENTTPNQRSVVVRATKDMVYKEVTVTQSEYLVEWQYYFTTSTPTLNFDALGTTILPNLNSYREKYINGSLVEGSREGVEAVVLSTTSPVKEVTPSGISLTENTTASERSGSVVYQQRASGNTVTIECNQAAATITTKEVLEWVQSGFGNVPAIGGSVTGSIRSGYWDVINGKNSTFHPVVPTIVSKPNYVTIGFTEAIAAPSLGNTYTMKLTFTENTGDARAAIIQLSYGSKSLRFTVNQLKASITWEYTFEATNSLLNFTALGGRGTPYNVSPVSTKQKYINGVATGDPVTVPWESSNNPDWVYVDDYWTALENTSLESRTGTATYTQEESGKTFTVEFEQAAATQSWEYTLVKGDWDETNIVYLASAGKHISHINPTVVLDKSYKQEKRNGKNYGNQISVPIIVSSDSSWLTLSPTVFSDINVVAGPNNDLHQYYEENTGDQRSAFITFTQEESGKTFKVKRIQAAATRSVTYDIRWGIADINTGSFTDHITEVSMNPGSTPDIKVKLVLVAEKLVTINKKTTKTLLDTNQEDYQTPEFPDDWLMDDTLNNYQEYISSALYSGFPGEATCYVLDLYSNRGNTSISERSQTLTVPNAKVMDGITEVGSFPSLLIKQPCLPYEQRSIFKFKNTDDTILNVTIDGDSGTSYSLNIESYITFFRDSQEISVNYRQFKKPSILTTLPSWAIVRENGQNADNSYNYSLGGTENDGSDRSVDIQFSNGESSTILHVYLLQKELTSDFIEIITNTLSGESVFKIFSNNRETDLTSYVDPELSVDTLKSWKIPRNLVPADDSQMMRTIEVVCQIPTDTNPQHSTFLFACQVTDSLNGLDKVLTSSDISTMNNFWNGSINAIDSNPTYTVENGSIAWTINIENDPEVAIEVNGVGGNLILAQWALIEKEAALDGTKVRIVLYLVISNPDSLLP